AFEISMLDDRFEPAEATIPVGTTVTWVNKGTHWHSVANLDLRFTSGKVFPGERFSFRFENAGVYKIYCQHHSMAGVNGTITVERPNGRTLKPWRDPSLGRLGVGSCGGPSR